MTVRLALSEQDEKAIEKQLATGRFADASDVVRAGLQILEELQSGQEHWLDAEVVQRIADAEQDPSRLHREEDVFSRLAQHHETRLARPVRK